jgi:subtilisin family serine protease
VIVPAAPPPPLAAAAERPALHATAPDPLVASQTHLARIGWTPPPRGGARPLVAVLDSGVDRASPDLAGAVLAGAGRSFVPESPDPGVDPVGHGTHVAGVIAATSGNGIGGSGVANARILPITVADAAGHTTSSALVRGLAYATRRGARVINMSLAGTGFSKAEQEAIDRAALRGALVVAAAGNTGGGAQREYPGAYRQVLAVGALAATGRPLAQSTRGPQVALAAPGQGVLSTAPGGSPALVPRTGASMAAAVVSGAAARLIAARPRLSAQQVRELLERTARDVPPTGPDAGSGAGAVDLAAALAAPAPARGDPEPNDDPALAAGTRPLLAAGGAPARTMRGRTGSWSDPRDGFVIELAAGQRLTATLRGPAAADLDLVLWRPGARGGARGRAYARTWLAAASLGPSSVESLDHVASAAGRYTLEVQGPALQAQSVRSAARYTLRASRGA